MTELPLAKQETMRKPGELSEKKTMKGGCRYDFVEKRA